MYSLLFPIFHFAAVVAALPLAKALLVFEKRKNNQRHRSTLKEGE